MYAKIILIGNVGRDPDVKYAQDGKSIVTFSVAYNEYKKDKDTGERIKSAEWFDVVCFSNQATFCHENVKKGSKVYIEGQPSFDKWEKDGVPQKKMKILLREIRLLDKKEEAPQSGEPYPTNKTEPKSDLTSPWPTAINSGDPNDNLNDTIDF